MATARQTTGKSGLAGTALALLTREAARMPLMAMTIGLKAWEQSRPVRELALRRGGEVLQIVAHTPLGRFLPQPLIDDGADAEAERIAVDARAAAAAAAARSTVKAAPVKASPPVAAVEAGAPTSARDLPIEDFDNVSIGSLRARLRSLSVEDLVTLREWEKAHANRLPVVTLLDNRIAKVSASS